MRQPGIGHSAMENDEFRELGHPDEIRQPGIGDMLTADGEFRELGHSSETCQPIIVERRKAEVDIGEIGQALQMLQPCVDIRRLNDTEVLQSSEMPDVCEWLIDWLLEKGGDDVAEIVDSHEFPKLAGHPGPGF